MNLVERLHRHRTEEFCRSQDPAGTPAVAGKRGGRWTRVNWLANGARRAMDEKPACPAVPLNPACTGIAGWLGGPFDERQIFLRKPRAAGGRRFWGGLREKRPPPAREESEPETKNAERKKRRKDHGGMGLMQKNALHTRRKRGAPARGAKNHKPPTITSARQPGFGHNLVPEVLQKNAVSSAVR